MVLDFQNINRNSISLPITSEHRKIASDFSAQQPTKQKVEQVYLNSLAVLVVNNYLNMLDIPTNLFNCDSWNPVMRACDNVADLEVFSLGKLECRPVRGIDSTVHIPQEVWDLRLGYVIVQLDDDDDYFKEATILGFIPQVFKEEVAINNLKPLEALIDHLHDIKESSCANDFVNLREWLNNVFTSGWETVESLLPRKQLWDSQFNNIPIIWLLLREINFMAGILFLRESQIFAWRFRNSYRGFKNPEFVPRESSESEEVKHSIQRAKSIDLGIQLSDRQIVLLVEITPEENGKLDITLQVHPRHNDVFVPENLSLKVIEPSGDVFLQAKARSQDNYIQLRFTGKPKEHFSVQIALNDFEFNEQFQL